MEVQHKCNTDNILHICMSTLYFLFSQ